MNSGAMVDSPSEEKNEKVKRSEWEIKDDVRAVKTFFKIHRDKERLEEVQEYIKANKGTEKAIENFADGDLQKALGI